MKFVLFFFAELQGIQTGKQLSMFNRNDGSTDNGIKWSTLVAGALQYTHALPFNSKTFSLIARHALSYPREFAEGRFLLRSCPSCHLF